MKKEVQNKKITLNLQNVTGEVLKHPELVKTVKRNRKLMQAGNVEEIVIPRVINNMQLLDNEILDLLSEVGAITDKDNDTITVNMKKLDMLQKSNEEKAKMIVEKLSDKYGVNIADLLKQAESIAEIFR